MVSYSFKAQFAEPIEQRHKRQTIRADRKRHARPGERIQLFVGMRTRHCRKIIPDPICEAVEPIDIMVEKDVLSLIEIDGLLLGTDAMEMFARRDGFDSLSHMHAFWLDTHGAKRFKGVIIKWKDQP